MATPIEDLPVEVAQGDLETRYVELGTRPSGTHGSRPGPTSVRS